MGKRLRFNKFILLLILEVIILIIAIWNNNKRSDNKNFGLIEDNSNFDITDDNKDSFIRDDQKDFKITYENEELDITVDNKDFNISDDNKENDKLDIDVTDDNKGIDKTKETFLVVIDPGHGGIDVGATSVSGLYERDFTFSLSKKVNEILEKEGRIQIYIINGYIDYKDRPSFANELNADLYISIHGNIFETPDVSGTESYYYNNESKILAEVIHNHVVSTTGFNDRGVKKEELFVVRDTEMPSVLLEVGYLTNPQEEQMMFDDGFQYLIAESICDGIKKYLEID
jgi:N-acetylmuramoyl-L-alanine amidase